jgi:hypothetical protein
MSAKCGGAGDNLCYNIPTNIDIAQNNTAAKRNIAKEPNPITPTSISGVLRDVLGTPL